MSDLVGKPEDRFSRVAAQMMVNDITKAGQYLTVWSVSGTGVQHPGNPLITGYII